MTKLKSKINRFFYRNQNKGIPNLMLYIAIGNLLVYLLYSLNRSDPLFYSMLIFDGEQILHGQIWRLLTYPLCYMVEAGLLWGVIGLFFYYWCGSILEQYWGVLRFNCFYLFGILLTDAAALALGGWADSFYVNLSLFLAAATLMPDEQVRLYFVIPAKMKWLAWLDLGLILYFTIRGFINMVQGFGAGAVYLGWLLPLVPVLNYLLFFGKQAANLLPDSLRYHPTRKSWQRSVRQKTVYADKTGSRSTAGNARFRCTVCGRTELTDPGLEFRYCSKCAGYRCYCEDHIHNHAHITE